MTKSTEKSTGTKKISAALDLVRREAAATGRTPMASLRLPRLLRLRIDLWRAAQGDKPGFSEAVRRLVEKALRTSAP
jgi:hypothetical protein